MPLIDAVLHFAGVEAMQKRRVWGWWASVQPADMRSPARSAQPRTKDITYTSTHNLYAFATLRPCLVLALLYTLQPTGTLGLVHRQGGLPCRLRYAQC
jgi:hypothetical protein